ncbi:MAG: glycerol-3-phosphate 1-O-acyltransferase PlsY [Gemmatimonadota bacterium]|nr:glycerol-3-phosphate 1-O-acyltransferase PlsY [Gemmatimonadota bacterium]
MIVAALLLASYLLGAFPSSYVAGRLTRGIDLRQYGSGNLGATNAFRVLGARVAAPVMAADMLKGFIPVAFFPHLDGNASWAWALAFGGAAILGHVFPVYMNFRGGKGVATATGVFLALSPVAVGVAMAVWLIVLRIWRMVSLASVVAAVVLVAALPLTESRPEVTTLGILVAVFVVFAHRSNIRRILRGEEYRFGSGGTKAGAPGESGADDSGVAGAADSRSGKR